MKGIRGLGFYRFGARGLWLEILRAVGKFMVAGTCAWS